MGIIPTTRARGSAHYSDIAALIVHMTSENGSWGHNADPGRARQPRLPCGPRHGHEHPESARALFRASTRLRRGPQYAQRDIQVTLAPSVSRRVLPSAARVRPASATARTTRRAMAPTMTLRRIGLPCVLSPPALPHGLRQNTRPSGYAGVVALRFASMCSSFVREPLNK